MQHASSVDLNHLRNFDLNLLVVLRMLLDTCSVSETARRLDSTQPSVSRMLDRLRQELGDPLLVKSSNSMIRTTRGDTLRPMLDGLLEVLQSVYQQPKDYQLAEEQRTCTIGANDSLQATLAAPLINALRELAPRAQVRFKPVPFPNPRQALQTREVDVLLGMAMTEDVGYRSTVLFESDFVCMCAMHNASIGPSTSIGVIADMPYLDVSHLGVIAAATDAMFVAAKRSKRTVATMSSFFAAANVIADSDRVCLVPTYMAPALRQHAGVRMVPLQGDSGNLSIQMIWHNVTHFDNFLSAVRGVIQRLVQSS